MRANRFRRRRRTGAEGRKSFERQHKIGQGVELHIQRTQAQLIVSQGVGTQKTVYPAMVMLYEFQPTGIVLFSQSPFGIQQQITLNIPNLRNFFAKGRVTACKEIPLSSGILPKSAYKYRLRIQFEFANEAERKAVEEYCAYLKREYLQTAKTAA